MINGKIHKQVIFHSYVSLPEGNKNKLGHLVNPITGHEGSWKRAPMMGMKCMCDVTHDVFLGAGGHVG